MKPASSPLLSLRLYPYLTAKLLKGMLEFTVHLNLGSSSTQEIVVSKENQSQIHRVIQNHICPTCLNFSVLYSVSQKVWAKVFN